MPIQLHHVSITCRDLEKCRQFYQDIGFEESRLYEDDETTIVLMGSDNTYIELFSFSGEGQKDQTTGAPLNLPNIQEQGITHLALKVDALTEIRETLLPNHRCSDIKQARLGAFSYFFTLDPEYNQIEFIQEHDTTCC